ncbi:MAG: insulinase family protein [Gillisia sp.]
MKSLYKLGITNTLIILLCLTSLTLRAKNLIETDSTFIKKVLPNGLTYYIKNIPDADEKVEMRFIVNAGSKVETSGQPDVSHAIEHLAFAETKNFPKGISSYSAKLKEAGMEGQARDMTAYTGVDGTIYYYKTHCRDDKGIELGLIWFHEILSNLSLSTKDIDIERERLIQERTSKGTNKFRKFDMDSKRKLISKLNSCSQNIDDYIQEIKRFAPDSLRAYYRDWYQPRNVAILVTGNVSSIDNLEEKIQRQFSEVKNRRNYNKKPNCVEVFNSKPNQFAIADRNTAQLDLLKDFTEIKFFYRDPLIFSNEGLEGFKRQIIWEMVHGILENSLLELTQSYQNQFNVEVRNVFKHRESIPASISISVIADSTNIKPAIRQIFTKINELSSYGLSEKSWNKIKSNQLELLKIYQSGKRENPKFWNDEFTDDFIFDLPLISGRYEKVINWINNLQSEEFNELLSKLIKRMPQDIGLIYPENSVWKILEPQLRTLISENLSKSVTKEIKEVPNELMTTFEIKNLNPSSFIYGKEICKGTREILLENGIRVIFLPEPDQDKLKVWGFKATGVQDLNLDNPYSATKSPLFIKHSGAGNYTKFEIERYLENKGVNLQLRPYIQMKEIGIKGEVNMKDSEILFQLIHLYLTAPRQDKQAFEHWKKSELKTFLFPPYTLQSADFKNLIGEYLGASNVDFLEGTAHIDGVKNANLEDGFKAYIKLFSNFNNYTFIVQGSVKESEVYSYVSKYLGNLPGTDKKEEKDGSSEEKVRFPDGPKLIVFEPTEFLTQETVPNFVRYIDKVDHYDWKKHLLHDILDAITWEKILKLRANEDVGFYNMYVGSYYNKDGKYFYNNLGFSASQDEIDKLSTASHRVFQKLKNGEIETDEFDKALNRLIAQYNGKSRNTRLDESIYNYYRFNIPLVNKYEKIDFLNQLKLKDIKKFAQNFLIEENLYEFKMK